jgi:hypothetical protein
VIRWGTTNEQETIIGTLGDIVGKAAHLKSPVVIVVGKVVDLRRRLDWFVPMNERSKKNVGIARKSVVFDDARP